MATSSEICAAVLLVEAMEAKLVRNDMALKALKRQTWRSTRGVSGVELEMRFCFCQENGL